MTLGTYILDSAGEPVPCPDYDLYAAWRIEADKRDGRRLGKYKSGDCLVSTVFLGIDHQFDDGPPLLFETMIRRWKAWGRQWRYTTRAEALAGHAAVVAWVKGEGAMP